MTKIVTPSNWKQCCTCARWGGERRPYDTFSSSVEYDSNSKGKCYQGGYNQQQTQGTGSCDKWVQQYKN